MGHRIGVGRAPHTEVRDSWRGPGCGHNLPPGGSYFRFAFAQNRTIQARFHREFTVQTTVFLR